MNETSQRAVRACLDAGIPVLLWGGPGIGKSAAVAALAARRNQHIEVVVGSVREPSDFAGLPVVGPDGRAVFMAPPAWALRLAEAEGGVLFLDELSTAPPAVQAAMLRLVLDRVVGELALPPGVVVVAAANSAEDAADGWDLAAPLANRFCHLDVAPDAEGFADGLTLGWDALTIDPSAAERVIPDDSVVARHRAEVAGFIRCRPELLMAQPISAAAAGRAWPSPRTWSMAAEAMARLRPAETGVARLVLTGLVGEGAAVEFLAWRAAADLPDPEAVLSDPAIFAWAGARADRVYAVLNGVVAVVAAHPTAERWVAAWKVLAAAADAGRADVGAAAARALSRCRPRRASVPRSAAAFLPVLAAAGLVVEGAA